MRKKIIGIFGILAVDFFECYFYLELSENQSDVSKSRTVKSRNWRAGRVRRI